MRDPEKGRKGRGVLYAALVLLALLAAALGTRILSVASLEKVAEPDFFTMEYKADYGLDKLLLTGAADNQDIVDFVSRQLFYGFPLEVAPPELECSSFVAVTPEGERLFGRNYDLGEQPVIFIRTAPADGYKSVSISDLSHLGIGADNLPTDDFISRLSLLALPLLPMDGMNERGLAVSVLMVPGASTAQETGKTPITTTTAIRMVLDKCADVDEAVAMLKQYDMHASSGGNFQFMLADRSGAAVVVEYIDNEFSATPAACVSNTPFSLGPDSATEESAHRYAVMEEALAAADGVLSAAQSMALLSAARHAEEEGHSYATQWSVVYNLTALTADIAVHKDYENVYSFALDPTS